MPAINKKDPSAMAFSMGIAPLGIGLSGLSSLSSLASKTSLKTTPPPYNPMVESINHSSVLRRNLFSESTATVAPEAAKPSNMSAIEVTIFAGRMSLR